MNARAAFAFREKHRELEMDWISRKDGDDFVVCVATQNDLFNFDAAPEKCIETCISSMHLYTPTRDYERTRTCVCVQNKHGEVARRRKVSIIKSSTQHR